MSEPINGGELAQAIRAALNKAGNGDSLGAYIPFTLLEIEHHILEAVQPFLARPTPQSNSQGANQKGLMVAALDGLESWTSGYAEESGKIVCSCCERSACNASCECAQLIERIRAALRPTEEGKQ